MPRTSKFAKENGMELNLQRFENTLNEAEFIYPPAYMTLSLPGPSAL